MAPVLPVESTERSARLEVEASASQWGGVGSWTALATRGASGEHVVTRVVVAAQLVGGKPESELHNAHPLRWIVQTFRAPSASSVEMLLRYGRPQAALERAVTLEQLERGAVVDLVQLDEAERTLQCLWVVAWVEQGLPSFGTEALCRRPQRGAILGSRRIDARRAGGRAA